MLPCGHTFANSCWEISNALFEVHPVELLELELRGPPVEDVEKTSRSKAALKDELIALLERAEKLVESHLSNVLRDFRQVGPGGQVPKKNAWFWNQSDERALKCALRSRCLLEASSILRRCAAKLQAWQTDGTELVDLGITCHLHNCLAECHHLLDNDLEGPPVDSDSEDDSEPQGGDRISQSMEVSTMSRGLTPKVIAKGKLSRRCTDIGFAMPRRTKARSLSAPPKFGIQEEQKCRDAGKSLDDSSLESLLHPVPKLATMDPRMILKRFYATLVGEGREDTVGQPVTTRAISSSSGIGSGDTWPVLCKEPRRLLESSGYVEPYDLSVAGGAFGMAVPLPTSMEKIEDLGAMIAHALLSSQHWEQLKPRLWGHGILDDMEAKTVRKEQEEIDFCSIDDEEAPIPISVQAPDGSRWQVEALAPLRFHLLRRLAFRNDANFCEMLRRCDPHSTSGGKSKSAFWKSQCGQLMLKEVRAAEAGHLASKAGPFAVRLAEALRGEPSLLCEVFGLFKVSRLGKRPSTRTIIIMRNLLNGIDDDWQIFDIKGAAHRHMPATATLEVPTGKPAPSSPASVKWDDCFIETFGALPKVLKPTDHEALELALKCDLHVLRELGLVDYSLLMAFNLEAKRVRLAIIDFLQPYTLNKQLESTVKKLVQRHEPTIVEPVQYAKRFHEFIRKAFQAAVGKTEVESLQTGEPKVNYRETITSKISYDYTHKRQSGGRGQYGKVIGYFEPVPEEEQTDDKDGITFVNKLVGNDIPPSYVPAIEKGFRSATQKGLLTGSPLIHMRCVLEDGAAHEVDSSSEAFQAAAQGAFDNFYHEANPVVLEPLMAVEVTFPSEFQPQALQTLNNREGSIQGTKAVSSDTSLVEAWSNWEGRRYGCQMENP
eukprot:symbB.v1.2.015509.t1/scaffold1160.1/size134679/18